MPRLTDPWFDARFYGQVSPTGCCLLPDDTIVGAQGLRLWCPCGYGALDEAGQEMYPLDLSLNKGRPHAIIVPFANPVGAPLPPVDHGPVSRDGSHHPRWTAAGARLDDLTITPSIAVGPPDCWHGDITNGEVK